MINHEYEKNSKMNKKKTGRKIIRNTEDKNTKTYVLDSDKLRITADAGGDDIIRGIEFTSVAQVREKGEIQEFSEILTLLEKKHNVQGVDISIKNLPKGKKFSKLNDGITSRKYSIGKITMIDGSENCLIEVEREDKALSMLLLKANKLMNWKRICSILMMGLVNESGKWDNREIHQIEKTGVLILRNKHIKRSVYEKTSSI